MKLTEGTTALVTGASSGIGASLARSLAKRGVTVGLVARRKERLEQVLADCAGSAPASRIWAADLGDLDLAERVALAAWDTFGHIDILVNNAGIPKRRHVTELPAMLPKSVSLNAPVVRAKVDMSDPNISEQQIPQSLQFVRSAGF